MHAKRQFSSEAKACRSGHDRLNTVKVFFALSREENRYLKCVNFPFLSSRLRFRCRSNQAQRCWPQPESASAVPGGKGDSFMRSELIKP